MTKPFIGTLRDTVDPGAEQGGYRFQQLPLGEVEVIDQQGIHRTESRDKRPGGSYLVAENARVRDDWIGRRPGTVEFMAGLKPNSNPVLKIVTAYLDRDIHWAVRVTKNTIHAARSVDAWVAFTGDAGAFSGINRRITTTMFQRWMFLASPHAQLMSIDFSNYTFKSVAGAPKAAFVVAYGDRVVCGNCSTTSQGHISTMIKWSGNGNPFEWDPLEDESAGENILDSAPSDYGDEITGLAVVGTTLVILRERSIWLVERNPVASNPFRFVPFIAGFGCDLPYTVASIPGGVVYADRRTNGVFLFAPGREPQRISRPVEDQLFADIDVSTYVEAAYDPFEMEYHLGLNVPNVLLNADGSTLTTSFITKTWVYNLKTQAWTYDIGPEVSTIGNSYSLHDLVMIDELTGTIDQQVADPNDPLKPNPDGYIDDWGEDPDDLFQPSLFKGSPTGEVIYHTYDGCAHEWVCDRFDLVLVSQNMGNASKRRTLKDWMMLAECPCPGRIQLAYSIDLVEWRDVKLIRPVPHAEKGRYGVPYQQISGDQLYWRLKTDIPGFRLFEWWARFLEKGKQFQR